MTLITLIKGFIDVILTTIITMQVIFNLCWLRTRKRRFAILSSSFVCIIGGVGAFLGLKLKHRNNFFSFQFFL